MSVPGYNQILFYFKAFQKVNVKLLEQTVSFFFIFVLYDFYGAPTLYRSQSTEETFKSVNYIEDISRMKQTLVRNRNLVFKHTAV